MPRPIAITTYKGAGDVDVFGIVSERGLPVDLNELMGVLVTVVVHNPDGADWTIDSSTSAVTFAGATVSVKFGQLQLPEGKYFPKIYYTHSANREPAVIVGKKGRTEVLLHAQH